MKPIVSHNVRIRDKKYFEIRDYSIVDDYGCFSIKIKIGMHCHIASSCSIAGGNKFQVIIGDYTSISSGVKIWCISKDYVNDLVILNPENKHIGDKEIVGDVIIGPMCAIGSNSVIMPGNAFLMEQ